MLLAAAVLAVLYQQQQHWSAGGTAAVLVLVSLWLYPDTPVPLLTALPASQLPALLANTDGWGGSIKNKCS